ncbi:hypothetical protein [Helicobacter sp. MIT 05-5294]|uniref:hypothetical protein n=1 Tax=Helicobacter sp. MIT 05-5294 TaxID=1548150 RepID=UPI0018837752|nr:hypothetical protein [Helicobacter sp. MIT 05-5294]
MTQSNTHCRISRRRGSNIKIDLIILVMVQGILNAMSFLKDNGRDGIPTLSNVGFHIGL